MTDDAMVGGEKPGDSAAGATPRQSKWLVVLAAFLFIGVGVGLAAYRFLPAFIGAIPDRPLSAAEKDRVFDCMRTPLMHENAARECVEAFGWQALPFYHAVIQDDKEPAWVRGNASLISGLYRDENTPQLIIQFVDAIAGDNMTREEMSAAAMALDGLGFTGHSDAVAYLERIASEDYWAQPDINLLEPEPEEPSRSKTIVRKRGVRALGLAPRGAGIDALERLQAAYPELETACEAALEDAKRRRFGLDRLDGL